MTVLFCVFALMIAGLSQTFAGVAAAAGPIASAGFAGGANTAVVSGTLFAKSGAALTLTVVTDTTVACVALSGAHTATATVPTSSTATTRTWSFTASAATGADGLRTTTVSVSTSSSCSPVAATANATYRVDNTGPVVSFALSQARNVHGWNTVPVTVTWSATDAGSGVVSGPTPATSSQSTNTAGTLKSSTATDAVGNVGNGSTVIKLDPTPPSVVPSRNPAANVNGWNNTTVTVSFTCSDGLSGIETCNAPSATFSTNVAGASASGSALDFAGNTTTVTVGPINIDKNAPTLSGTPLTSPNGAGWYNSNVTVDWTCSDTGGSGFAANACDDTVISGEGVGLTTSRTVTDLAGNVSAAATSSPAVQIDRTNPVTAASSVVPWSATDVTVGLTATDALSGVASTHFKMDGGSDQTYGAGNVPTFASDGAHMLEFWSVDAAGNEEAHQSLAVGVDKTAPVVVPAQVPAANADGWNSSPVVVSFSCSDATSGVRSCPADVTVSNEGANQPVSGTAFDNAGNSSTATTTVSVDMTVPTISGVASPAANSSGWNNTSVVVSYSCADALSGVASCATDATVSGEGAGQSVSGLASDRAGNGASATVGGINIDKTAPTINGTASPAANAFGWNNTDVVVSYSCSDALSGLLSCAPNETVGGEGAGQSVTGSSDDRAGNHRSVTVSGINVDKTAPAVRVVGVVDGATYDQGAFAASCSTSDALSGVDAPAALSQSGGPTGPVTFTCRGASDRAGNAQARAVTVTINVRSAVAAYRFGGFLRPLAAKGLNDVNSGQAVPVKFSLGGYRGMTIFAAGFPASVAYKCGTVPPTTGFEAVGSNGGLTYDAASDTYSFVWKTTKTWTGCRMLQLNFSDGSTASALFNFTK